MTSLTTVVRRFRILRALVIGDAILDTCLEGTSSRLCTQGLVPVVQKTAEEQVPGGAANTAANLTALSAEVLFLCLIGRDEAGTLLWSTLRSRGVDASLLVEDDRIATLQKVRIRADDQYVVRFDAGDTRSHGDDLQPTLAQRLEKALLRCDLVVISDYCYGVVGDLLLDRLRELRSARRCPLIVDSKDLRRFEASGATLVTPNQLETRLAVGGVLDENGREEAVEAIERVQQDRPAAQRARRHAGVRTDGTAL